MSPRAHAFDPQIRAVWMTCLLWSAACGGTPATTPVAPAPAPVLPPDAGADAAPDASPPDAEPSPVGAVPVPSEEDRWRVATLDEVDTTVTLDDLRTVRGAWPKRVRLAWSERVMLALHAESDNLLHLTAIQSDEGERKDYALGAVAPETFNHTFDGNTYLSRQGAEGTGPIVFAVRVLPPPGAASRVRRQVVVYSDGASLRVVDRPLGSRTWTPRLRIDFAPGTAFVGIGTTDPH